MWKLKFFHKTLNIKEDLDLASIKFKKNILITKFNLLDTNGVECANCKSRQNVKLANIAPISENNDENQYPLCENCRKASFKVIRIR
ncbi:MULTISPECIES: hypothetical protein [unclassified Chryseobacterium]|uniref:hypothetical protein n=1 Tax=unclassified Chryseobacterium TaxID=2593645 RepID=UPI0009546464|nr:MULTISPECIES: hypothetical protein [unclassified Chryseobacterium]SIR72180.1 hypothetical protein SAMN05880573_1384 [Chryseobacterium sp. RU33C]